MPDFSQATTEEGEVMTLGDFMSFKPAVDSGGQTESIEEFMGVNDAPPIKPIPEEHKNTFLRDMSVRFMDGAYSGASNFNEVLGFVTGLNQFEPYKKYFVNPAKTYHEQVGETAKPENLGSKIAYDFAFSLGNLGVTLPADVMTGGATKAALAGKILPHAETLLTHIPDFALGSGWRGLIEGLKDTDNPLEGAVLGLEKASENVAFGTLYGYSGHGLKGIANMTGLGVASSFYESAKMGRLPSKDEMTQGAAEGAAYGVLFSMIPMLREGTKNLKEGKALKEYQKEIDFQLSKGDLHGAKETTDRIIADERIRPQIKETISTILAPQMKSKEKQEFFEDVYQKSINRFQSIENLVLKAKALGAEISPGVDAGLSAERYLSVANQARNTLEYGTFFVTKDGGVVVTGEGLKPILDRYDKQSFEKNTNLRKQDLNDYLIARRTFLDLQRPKSERDPDFIATPEQTKEAEGVLETLEKKYQGKLEPLEDAAKELYDYQQRILHLLVDSGNMSQESFDTILSKNPNYVPFDRILPEEAPTGVVPKSKERFTKSKSPVKKIKGSELEIHDPIESMIKNTYRIMDVATRNKVWNDVYSLKEIKELGINESEAPTKLVSKGNILQGYVNGEVKYLKVSDNLFDAMSGLTEQSSSMLVKILSKPAQWLRIGATTTPEFVLRNPIRDQWTALIQTNVGFKPFIDTGAAIADVVGKSDVYNDWIRSGGSYAGFVELSRPRLSKMLTELQGKPNILSNLNIVTKLGDLSQLMEQATRVGVFKAGLKKGLSSVEASKASREATVDFARKGSGTRDLNSTIAFFNASLQAVDKNFRTLVKDPGGLTLKAVSTITIPSLLLYLRNRNDPEYKELPRWQKDLFWMFKINDVWFRVPKPFTYGQIFGSLPERFFEYLDTRDSKALDGLAGSLYDSLSPVAGDPLSGLLPTAVKPLIENKTNYSFFRNREIVPEWKEKLLPSEQYSAYDTQTSKLLGKVFNVSPSEIENLAKGWFGGMGRYGLEATDVGIQFINTLRGIPPKPKKPIELSDIPLIKGFVSRDITSGQAESVQTFYENRDKIASYYFTFNKFKREGDKEAAIKLKSEHPEMNLYSKFNSYSKQFSDIGKKVDTIIKTDLTDEEKRNKIKALELKKIAIAQKANELL